MTQACMCMLYLQLKKLVCVLVFAQTNEPDFTFIDEHL